MSDIALTEPQAQAASFAANKSDNSSLSGESIFKCLDCERIFNAEQALSHHINIDHEGLKYAWYHSLYGQLKFEKLKKRKNFLTSLTAVTIISKTKDKSRKTKSSVYRCMKIWLISILTWDELLSTLCPFSRLVTETILGLRRFCIATVYSEIGSLVAAQLCDQSHCNGAGALAATTSSKT